MSKLPEAPEKQKLAVTEWLLFFWISLNMSICFLFLGADMDNWSLIILCVFSIIGVVLPAKDRGDSVSFLLVLVFAFEATNRATGTDEQEASFKNSFDLDAVK